MEDEVKDAILTGISEDVVLLGLIEITLESINSGRPIYTNPLTEPSFYRKHFRRWVEDGLDEARRLSEQTKQAGEQG